MTSAVGAISHARAGRVQWRTGLTFGVAGMTGAYAGGRVAAFIPGQWLLIGFAVMMVATALAMLRGRPEIDPADAPDHLPTTRVIIDGLVVGLVTGLVGAGTSLVVIAMKSMAGMAGYLASVTIDWQMAAMVTGAAVLGALLGGPLAGRIAPETLRRLFGWFVLIMAIMVGAQEAPGGAWTWTVVALGAVLLVGTWLALRRQQVAVHAART